jgi:hypothetical protein
MLDTEASTMNPVRRHYLHSLASTLVCYATFGDDVWACTQSLAILRYPVSVTERFGCALISCLPT